jgi:hypothetical protein
LRCPFGCRHYHRKDSSKKRSAEYYRSQEGKDKKKALNERRSRQTSSDTGSKNPGNEEPAKQQEQIIQDEFDTVRDKSTVSYIQMLISLIEGRKVCLEEIMEMLRKIVRQHSIDRKRRFVYAFTYPEQKPP